MVRIPASWGPGTFHLPAQSGPGGRVSARPIGRQPIQQFSTRVTGVPLQPAQQQTIISAAGTGTVTLGPTGAGTVWYPTQAIISTTTGVLDTSTFTLYIGPVGIPITLVGTLYPGGAGTVSLAIPNLTPGLYLIGQWTGGHSGDVAAMNVVGTMSAVAAP